MDIDYIIPEIRPRNKKPDNRAKSKKNLIISFILIIAAAILVVFWPMKVSSRILTEQYIGIDISGSINYLENNEKQAIEIHDNRGNQEFLAWIGKFMTVRSFKNKKTLLAYSDHSYTFRLVDRRTYEIVTVTFNGRYIEITEGKNYRKYRIVLKDSDISELDEMMTNYIDGGYTEPLIPISGEDKSIYIADYIKLPPGWIEVVWTDGHHEKDFMVSFSGYKPFSNIEIYEDAERRLVIFCEEGEGVPGEINIALERLPSHPDYLSAKIVFFRNGVRSYNTSFIYAKE